MHMRDFALEVFFEKHEFTAPYLLAQSDCEAMTAADLLAMEPGAEAGYLGQWMGYTETWGDPELRELIAGLYESMQPEDILVLHGAQEGIFAFMNVVLEPGDNLIALFPNYQSAYEVANSVPSCTLTKWVQRDMGDHWEASLDDLEALIGPNTKAIAINSPSNPTGFTFSNDKLARLAAICEERGIYLFADEVYMGLELDGQPRRWAADASPRATSLGVMSKSYGLPGLRIGWLASKDHDLLQRIQRFRLYTTICNAGPSEYLAKVALRHGDQLLARSRGIIERNMQVADAFFAKHAGLLRQKHATCGPIAFHELLLDMPVQEFCQRTVDRSGVLLLPGSVYEMPGNYFRMGYGRANFPKNLAILDDFLDRRGWE